MLLLYLSKRIHFSTKTFKMRMNLAVLDWVRNKQTVCTLHVHIHVLCSFSQNENVNCAYTSTHRVADLRRPDRRTAMKVLEEKGYNFVDKLWESYIAHNKTDLR